MKLFEFFGNINHDVDRDKDRDSQALTKEEEQEFSDNVFWYIIDEDDLHKKYFLPIAKDLKKKYDDTTDDDSVDWKVWLPIVNAGCTKYYKDHKIDKHPKDAFQQKFRMELCKRLEDHFHQDIAKGEYNLGN